MSKNYSDEDSNDDTSSVSITLILTLSGIHMQFVEEYNVMKGSNL